MNSSNNHALCGDLNVLEVIREAPEIHWEASKDKGAA
jgi:hypothetical protein